MKKYLFLALTLASSPVYATAQQSSGGPDKAEIEQVMATYHNAVVQHSGQALSSLFLAEGGTWLNVLSDAAYSKARTKSEKVAKVRVSSYQEFAKFVETSKADLNPTHTNVQISTDGTIASVYFDFAFLVNGKSQNRGSESWQLVKLTEGWRIATIVYSSTPSAQP